MNIQILHNGYDEIYDVCQIHLLKLNEPDRYSSAFSLSKNEQGDFSKVLIDLEKFSNPDRRLKLFFDIECHEVSFISQYILKTRGKNRLKTLGDLEKAIRSDVDFKNHVVEYYFGEKHESDKTVQRALMSGSQHLSLEIKVMLHNFLNFYNEHIELLIQSLYKIQKEVDHEYQRSNLLLKRLQSGFDLSLLTDNDISIRKWSEKLLKVEVSFTLFNRYLVMRGDLDAESGWIVLGVDYVTLVEQQWKIQVSMVEICKALGDNVRMKMFIEIQQCGELSASAIAKIFNYSVKLAFYHLEILKDAQILSSKVRGRNTYYSINEAVCRRFLDEIKFIGE